MTAMRIRDVQDLGRQALIVSTSAEPLLLLDAGLTHDQRMKVLNRLFEDEVDG